MNRKIAIATAAALSVAATASSASAQGWHHDRGWGHGFHVGIGVGDAYAYRPGFGVAIGNDWGYRSYAAAPAYGCTCPGVGYRTSYRAYQPGYRYSSYASAGYPNVYYDDDDDDYGYASVGFGWSDDGWRDRRYWRGDSSDRVRVRASFSERDRVYRGRDRGSVNARVANRNEVRIRDDARGRNGDIRGRSVDRSTRATVNGRTAMSSDVNVGRRGNGSVRAETTGRGSVNVSNSSRGSRTGGNAEFNMRGGANVDR
jgi:hypothetical protein